MKQALEDAGIDADVTVRTVDKMNESYEAMTVTPEGSNGKYGKVLRGLRKRH